jgi:hypothetical protein
MARFKGSTEEAGGSFLGADFWKKGVRIEGQVTGSFETEIGKSYSLTLKNPVTINGDKHERVSLGGLKGLSMALRAAGVPNQEFQTGDAVVIECTGMTPTEKGNPQINFKILVDR